MSKRPSQISLERHLRNSSIAAIFLVGGMGYVGATSELSGAVVAIGSLVVETNIKKIQHPTGGIVAELYAREGDRVEVYRVLTADPKTARRKRVQKTRETGTQEGQKWLRRGAGEQDD